MGRRVNVERLRELEFPERVIEEAQRAEALGLSAVKPSPDLVERTMEACKHLLPPKRGVLGRILGKILGR